MSESVRDLLVRGVAAAKAKEGDEACFYLEWVLRLDPSADQRVEALFWLSEVCADPQEKRGYLEEALIYQPNYYPARRGLAVLNGRLDPGEIVDPDHLPASAGEERTPGAQRFDCPQCGGPLTYAPDGQSLVCKHCQHKQSILNQPFESEQASPENDFTLALSTAKGHRRPVATPTFKCQACGAIFLLSPGTLSMTCPYCGSVYVVASSEQRELIPPQGIIPFMIAREQAEQALQTSLKEKGLTLPVKPAPLRGLYLPAWTFNLTCLIPWEYSGDDEAIWAPRSGRELISYDNIVVPAILNLAGVWVGDPNTYPLDLVKVFKPAYLADIPAETYQISLSDASLSAREAALERARAQIARELSVPERLLKLDSSSLLIESFRLILFPLWLSDYLYKGKRTQILVNGATGTVLSEKNGV